MKTLNDKIRLAVEVNDMKFLSSVARKKKKELNLPINNENETLLVWAIRNKKWSLISDLLGNSEVDINLKVEGTLPNEQTYPLHEIVNMAMTFATESENLEDNRRFLNILRNVVSRYDIDLNVLRTQNKVAWTLPFESSNLILSNEQNKIVEDIKDIFFDRNDINLDVNTQNAFGRSPLMYAVRCDDIDNAKKILAKKADVNLIDNTGSSALHHVHSGEMAELLLNVPGIDVNIQDRMGEIPFEIMLGEFKYGDNSFEKPLLNLVARKDFLVNQRTSIGAIPLIEIYKHGTKEMFDIMFAREDLDVNAKSYENDTLLNLTIEAIKKGDQEFVFSLFKREDFDINAFDENGVSVLMQAIVSVNDNGKNGKAILDKILMNTNLDINASASNEKGSRNALTTAIEVGDEKIIDTLLKRRDIDINKPYNFVAFDSAVAKENYDLLRRLAKMDQFKLDNLDLEGANIIGHICKDFAPNMPADEFGTLCTIVLDVCKGEEIQDLLNHKDEIGNTSIMSVIEAKASASSLQTLLADVVRHFGYVEINMDSIPAVINAQQNEDHKNDLIRVIKTYKNIKTANEVKSVNETKEEIVDEEEISAE